MSGLPITFACGLYDRMLALHTGEVKPDGIDLNFLAIDHPREIFDRMANNLEFDAAEMSSSDYFRHAARGDCPMVAIPVFPSRVFRHGYIAVDKRVREPKDLAGKRIGVPLYAMTAAIFIRGLLQHDHGVDLSGVTWVEGGMNDTKPHGAPSTIPLVRPVKLELLLRQDVAQRPAGVRRHRRRHRLRTAEVGQDQPQHRAAVPGLSRARDRLLPAHENLPDHASRGAQARGLREASVRGDQPLQRLLRRQGDRATARCASSARCATCCRGWRPRSRRSTQVFGGDPWPYGIDANRPSLDALVQYLADQALIEKPVPVESLFAPIFGQASKP